MFPLPEIAGFDRIAYSPLLAQGEDAEPLGHASFTVASEPDGAEFVHRLNLYGFRDGEWRADPETSRPRVAIVGDSMVEGFMAAQGESIPDGFARAARSEGNAVEALNLGVSGANLASALELIRDAVPALRPSHLILVLYANDLQLRRPGRRWFRAPRALPRANPWLPRALYVADAAWERRRIPRRWISAPFAYAQPVPHPANPFSSPDFAARAESFVEPQLADAMRRGRFNPYLAGILEYWDELLRQPVELRPAFAQLRDYASAHGASLAIVYLPSRNQVSDRYIEYQLRFSRRAQASSLAGESYQLHARQLAALCAELALPFLDLTPELRRLEARGPELFWRYDEHLRGAAYLEVGELLHAWWRAQNWK